MIWDMINYLSMLLLFALRRVILNRVECKNSFAVPRHSVSNSANHVVWIRAWQRKELWSVCKGEKISWSLSEISLGLLVVCFCEATELWRKVNYPFNEVLKCQNAESIQGLYWRDPNAHWLYVDLHFNLRTSHLWWCWSSILFQLHIDFLL